MGSSSTNPAWPTASWIIFTLQWQEQQLQGIVWASRASKEACRGCKVWFMMTHGRHIKDWLKTWLQQLQLVHIYDACMVHKMGRHWSAFFSKPENIVVQADGWLICHNLFATLAQVNHVSLGAGLVRPVSISLCAAIVSLKTTSPRLLKLSFICLYWFYAFVAGSGSFIR